DAAWKQYLQSKEARVRTTVPVPNIVRVEGTSDAKSAEHLESFLERFAGQPVDTQTLDHFLTRLTGIGKYDSADYHIGTVNNQAALIVTLHEINYAPPTLRLGFTVDGSEPDNVTFTQSAQVTFMDIAGFRSEWRTNLQFGNTYGIQSELYKPLADTAK